MNKKTLKDYGKHLLRILLLLFVTAVMFMPTEAVAKASPQLSASQIRIVLDQTYTLTMKNTGSTVNWSTSDASIVSVKRTGKNKASLKAVGKGTASITGQISGNAKKFVCKVTVYDPVKLSSSGISLTKGKATSLKITGTTAKPA